MGASFMLFPSAKLKSRTIFFFALCALLLLAGCSSESKESSLLVIQDNVMTIPYRIQVAGPLAAQDKITISSIISSTFHEIDAIYNKWNPHSELSKINESRAGQSIPLSRELYQFMLLTATYVAQTGGKFDPTIEPLQKVWKDALQKGQLPSMEDIDRAASFVGWDKMTLEGGSILKGTDGVKLDLGGLAKGYAVDLLVERLNAAGYRSVFVEWGGEIRATGNHPERRPWTIYISRLGDPDPSRAVAILDVSNKAVATSGDYLQQWTVGNQTYFHIINAKALKPLVATHTSIASVTVLADTCLEADVLATTAMLFSTVAEAQEWAKQFPHATFWILSRQTLAGVAIVPS